MPPVAPFTDWCVMGPADASIARAGAPKRLVKGAMRSGTAATTKVTVNCHLLAEGLADCRRRDPIQD